MKQLMILACALALPSIAVAADHGPVFSYATPVNSQRELSFDSGVFGRYGSQGTQFSTGSNFGYGVTPHFTVTAFMPAMFGSGALPESRIISGSEWSAGAASLLSAAPWLVGFSRHKVWTFSIAGTLIAASFVMTYVVAPRLRAGESCDADDPTACGEVSRVSRFILWASAAIWSGGFFVAYLLGPILQRMDR